MASVQGRIKAEDIAAVKERSSIEDVVREHVNLRSAGPGSLKGLCPFHDEKTPSFTVRPAVGSYHCFGCGEGGDVLSFVQKVEHLSFIEAVERLADKLGMQLVREDEKDGPKQPTGPRRARLVEAHRVAQEFYAAALLERPDARIGRDFLRSRGFDGAAAKHFGVGYAPRGGEVLARHLREKGITEEEMTVAGLCGRSARGLYDKFRGRLVWPISDITGDVIGFGARRLFDDDPMEAKYLNTAETPIYKKSQVLYGLDLAKKSIQGTRQAVIVEGYTDVMAAQLSGIDGAVATCGTAFGVEHIKVLRRVLRDEADLAPAKVIFTFDGDAAGQKAAMKAFGEDQRWASQSFVAVAPDGMDPCELRLAKGPEAVQALVEDAVPMFEFAVRTTIARFDLNTAEGRISAMKAAAPIVASIRDSALRPEYIRTVSGWLGVDPDQLRTEVARAAKAPRKDAGPEHRTTTADNVPEPSAAETSASMPMPDLRDPLVSAERQLLQSLLQYPGLFVPAEVSALPAEAFIAPAHRAVFDGVRIAGGPDPARSTKAWIDAVTTAAPMGVQPLVAELAVAPLPVKMDKQTGQPERRYVAALLRRVHDVSLTRQIADAMSALQRLSSTPDADPAQVRELSERLQLLQRTQAMLRHEGD